MPAEALIPASNSASSNLAEGRWLGIQVEQEEELTPRVMLVSVPFALKAADSERLGGRSASDFVLVDQLKAPVGVTRLGVGSAAVGGAAAPAVNNKADQQTPTVNNIVAVPAVTKANATSMSGATMQFTYTFFDANTDLPAVTVPGIYVDLVYAFTIKKVYCQINGGSATINLTKNGSSILTSGLACTTTGASSSFNSGQSSIAVGNQIGHVTSTAGAGLRRLNVVIQYTVN